MRTLNWRIPFLSHDNFQLSVLQQLNFLLKNPEVPRKLLGFLVFLKSIKQNSNKFQVVECPTSVADVIRPPHILRILDTYGKDHSEFNPWLYADKFYLSPQNEAFKKIVFFILS